jgi:hypothetical protein
VRTLHGVVHAAAGDGGVPSRLGVAEVCAGAARRVGGWKKALQRRPNPKASPNRERRGLQAGAWGEVSLPSASSLPAAACARVMPLWSSASVGFN